MAMQPFKSAITIASLTDDLLAEILLRLPSPASLARAALASKRWRGVSSTPDFLSRFRARHTTSPLLGLFVSHANSGLPVFHPAAPVRSDPDLAAAVRGGDFSLTRLEEDPEWCLRDCRNGRLLLSRGNSVNIYDPIFRRRVAVCRPQNDPFPDTYIADCLLHGRGDDGAASFRVVSVQQHGRRMRAGEYDSGTLRWHFHPWMENIKRPQRGHAMHAAGLIFWKCEENSSLLLDTSTMEFSMLRLPVSFFQPSKYAIGEIEDGVCCLVCLNGTMDNLHLQVWLLTEKGGGKTWELEKEMPVCKVLGRHARVRQVRTVATGLVLVCWDERYPQFAIDLKNLSLNSEFMCSGLAYPFQMPWPPAVLVSTEEVQPVQLVHPAEFVPPLQMSTRMVSLDTLVHHVDLAAERINVVAYTEGPLNLILGPHDPFDTEHVMAAKAANLVATADMEQVMAAEAQSLFAIEKTESQEQTSKGPDVPILRRSSRVVERSGGRYENVVRKAMERKASCRDDVELLSALLGRSCSGSENPRGHWILFWDHMSPLTQNKSWLLKKRTCRQLQTRNKSQLLKQTTYWQLKKLRSRLGRGGEERNGGRYENVVRNALESKAHCRDHEELLTREILEMPDLARGESRVGGISKPLAMEGSNLAAASRVAEAAGGNTPAASSGAVPGVAATTEVQEEMEALVASIPVGAGAAFSAMQLQELEKQSLVYQYMAACIRVPTHLVFPIWKSVTSASSEGTQKYPTLMGLEKLCLDFGKNPEPEPGRCRRTDGKKWRCCRNVIPNEKYCERHTHRSRKRPVQLVVEDAEPDSASGSKSASSKATEGVKKTDDKSSISKNLAVEAPAAL